MLVALRCANTRPLPCAVADLRRFFFPSVSVPDVRRLKSPFCLLQLWISDSPDEMLPSQRDWATSMAMDEIKRSTSDVLTSVVNLDQVQERAWPLTSGFSKSSSSINVWTCCIRKHAECIKGQRAQRSHFSPFKTCRRLWTFSFTFHFQLGVKDDEKLKILLFYDSFLESRNLNKRKPEHLYVRLWLIQNQTWVFFVCFYFWTNDVKKSLNRTSFCTKWNKNLNLEQKSEKSYQQMDWKQTFLFFKDVSFCYSPY